MKEIKKEKRERRRWRHDETSKKCLLFNCNSALLFSSAKFGEWVNTNGIFYKKERTIFHQKRM